eukprot:scaffold202401_cov15-Prasinocladus_malaysianus.AAC.1
MSATQNNKTAAKLRGRLCINAEFPDGVGRLCGPYRSPSEAVATVDKKAIPALPFMFGAYVLKHERFQPSISQTSWHGSCNLPYMGTVPSVVAGGRAFQSQILS